MVDIPLEDKSLWKVVLLPVQVEVVEEIELERWKKSYRENI
jgi:hypothetical protein